MNALLHGIICSKRLLADHVDALEQCHPIELEQCYDNSIAKTGRKFTFVKTLALGSVAAATFKTKSDWYSTQKKPNNVFHSQMNMICVDFAHIF